MTHESALRATGTAEPRFRANRVRVEVAGILLVVAALLLYAATLDTGLQPHELHGGDLITHQYAQVQARPSNAPGYPLYTAAGWLWFHTARLVLRLLGWDSPNPVAILGSFSTLSLPLFFKM